MREYLSYLVVLALIVGTFACLPLLLLRGINGYLVSPRNDQDLADSLPELPEPDLLEGLDKNTLEQAEDGGGLFIA